MTIEEVLQHDLKFRYMLLGRLQADCEYYLGFGNKSSRRLWAGSEKAQIDDENSRQLPRKRKTRMADNGANQRIQQCYGSNTRIIQKKYRNNL